MKIWEMIKELSENPNKKFSYKGAQSNSYVTVEDGKIVWRGDLQNGQEMAIGFIDERDREWEEVKEPVSFMEAIESGKKIRVEHNNIQRIADESLNSNFTRTLKLNIDGKYLLSNFLIQAIAYYSSKEIFEDIILNGKWYIE